MINDNPTGRLNTLQMSIDKSEKALIAKRNRRRGKKTEKAVAKIMGGKAIGALSGEDIFHPIVSIECKDRKKFVGKKWLEQAQRNATNNKAPLVYIHITGERHINDMILMYCKDFQDFFGRIKDNPMLLVAGIGFVVVLFML